MAESLTPLEQDVIDRVKVPALLDFLDELVRLKSFSGNETPAQEAVAAKLEQIGMDLDVWELDFQDLSRHPAFSTEIERDRGLGVVGQLGEGDGPILVLNGHVDVVPAGEPANWTVPPWQTTVKDGLVYGRGALDMKGGLCCAIAALQAVQDAGVSLKGKTLLQSVIGEEDGGVGTLAAVLRGHVGDAGIIMEPTELMLAPAQAGALNFRVTIPGLAAHGAVRAEGVSAIEKFIPIYQAIMDLERQRNARVDDVRFASYDLPIPICVGTVSAGSWASTVAESLHFEGRFGVAVDENLDSARDELVRAIEVASRQDPWLRLHPPELEWWGGQFAPAGIPLESHIVDVVRRSFKDLCHRSPEVRGMTYGADMRLLVNQGDTPTIMFGPGDVRKAHQPDEHVPLADLEMVAQTLALSIIRFCGVGSGA